MATLYARGQWYGLVAEHPEEKTIGLNAQSLPVVRNTDVLLADVVDAILKHAHYTDGLNAWFTENGLDPNRAREIGEAAVRLLKA
jgi:hypothetical protein